jgi:hypothetical protein
VSYQVRLLYPGGYVATSFASLDMDEVWIWLAKNRQDGRFTKGTGRRWIEARGQPAFRKGNRWRRRGWARLN